MAEKFSENQPKNLEEEEKRKQAIKEECRKLDDFFNSLVSSKKTHVQVEKKVYGIDGSFYSEYEKLLEERRREQERRREEKERKRQRRASIEAKRVLKERRSEDRRFRQAELYEEKKIEFKDCVYAERGLSKRRCDELMNLGYKRVKLSPFGDSGAAFFWVKQRYNESKEHAFFCYLIASEVNKRLNERHIQLPVNYGADVEFDLGSTKYCFEVETGTALVRNEKALLKKFARSFLAHEEVYVFVTNKRLKYTYAKHAPVVTRASLKDTLKKIFEKELEHNPKALED